MSRIFIEKSHPVHNVLAGAKICVGDATTELTNGALTIGFINLMPKPIDPVRDFCTLFARHATHNIRVLDFTPTPKLYSTKQDKQALRSHLLPLTELPNHKFDALILTGFGGEEHAFEDIRFWDEITSALDHAKETDTPMLASCWGSHAALYHHHNVIKKCDMTDKISGVFAQSVIEPNHPLMRGVSSGFTIPVSRYGRSCDDAISSAPSLTVLAQSNETGTAIVTDERVLYLTGHPEYPADALPGEYARDLAGNTPHLRLPENVFINDDPSQGALPISWDKDAGGLAKNWLDSVHANAQNKQESPKENKPLRKPALAQ